MKEKKTNLLQVLARRALLVVLDGAIVAFSFYFALLLRADGAVEASWWPHNRALLYANLPWIVAVYLLSFLAGRLYTILWKYAGERDLIRLAGMIAVPTGIVYLVNRCFIHGVLFNSANAMAAVLIFLFIGGSRLAWRLFLNHPLGERLRGNTSKDPNRPVMIVGAGEAGAWAINVCKTNTSYGHVIVAVDDDPNKLGQTIHGVPVRGTLEEIPDLCTRYNIHTIIVAIPTLKGTRLNHVIDLCVSTHCAVQMLSDPQLVGAGTPQQGAFRELNTADFLSREEVTLDTEKISGYLTGKTVLVTGGGGSIGSELCRQVMRFKPAKLLIFDIYENCAYELLMELQQKENMALVLITHDLALVAEAAHKIIVMYAGQVVETGSSHDIFRAPRHPYTQALLRALPEFAQDKARLASLPGVVPGKYDRPQGCLLNPRCPYATDKCRAEEPELNQLADGRQSKCHYPLDDAGRPTL